MDHSLLEQMFRIAVAQAQPALAIAQNLPPRPRGRTVVIGAGKASAQMARAFELAWDGPLSGLVVTRYGYGEV
jgi:glycerate 2-kinase